MLNDDLIQRLRTACSPESPLGKLCSEAAIALEAAFAAPHDDPEMDAIDGAHPAWWRGNDRGVEATVAIINNILDGKRQPGTYGSSELTKLAQRLAASQDAPASVPVAWLRVETIIHPEVPAHIDTTTNPEVAKGWAGHPNTASLTPLFAAPPPQATEGWKLEELPNMEVDDAAK
jgi:hypothetical protein